MISVSKIKCLLSKTLVCSFFYISTSIMSSIFGYVCILFYCLTLYIITIDTRSINEKDSVELIADNLSNDHNQQIEIILANYRHRFDHSTHLKKLRWALKHRYNKAYCEFCDLVVPVVRCLSNKIYLFLNSLSF
jgi:hypothetical protein